MDDIRVMLVDGDPVALAAAGSILQTAGFNVVAQLSDADRAIEVAAGLSPDVLVIDMDLPGVGASATVRRIRDVVDHRVEVVALASFSQAHRLGDMVATGTVAYVVKGKPAELVGAVRAARAGAGLLSAEASQPVLEEMQKLYQRERSRTQELEETVSQLQALSVTDWLTGLKNHGYFFDRLSEELERSRRYGRTVAVILGDLDDFKAVNDAYGHSAGDAVLRAVGGAFTTELREVDVACRLGGEEFGVIMPETDEEGAMQAAERLRRATASAAASGVGAVTMSLGVAMFPAHGESRDGIVQAADRALYRAKSNGKNRAESTGDGTASARPRPDGRLEPVIGMMLRALRMRSAPVADHSVRVAELAQEIGEAMNLDIDDLASLRAAALLHDVGRLSLPDVILSGGTRLAAGDWDRIRRHPLAARELLSGVVPRRIVSAVVSHHEHLDGSGYPEGLVGDDIPRLSRVILVADAFDAMTSSRPYRAAMSEEKALAELRDAAGTIFDPEIVQVIEDLRDRGGEVIQFPVPRAG